jgi:flagellar motility protein MotE (MotC chaperone)
MSDLVQDAEVIRDVVARLQMAMDQLASSQRRIVQVEPRAFGASDQAARTQRQVGRAYDAIQQTLATLSATHDEFAAQLAEVDQKLRAIDEEVAADARRALEQIESAGGAA